MRSGLSWNSKLHSKRSDMYSETCDSLYLNMRESEVHALRRKVKEQQKEIASLREQLNKENNS